MCEVSSVSALLCNYIMSHNLHNAALDHVVFDNLFQ